MQASDLCLSAKHKIVTKNENHIKTHAQTNNQYYETLTSSSRWSQLKKVIEINVTEYCI